MKDKHGVTVPLEINSFYIKSGNGGKVPNIKSKQSSSL